MNKTYFVAKCSTSRVKYFLFQIITNTVYSGTHKYVTNFLSKFGIEVTWVDVMDGVEGYKKNIRPNTKVCNIFSPVSTVNTSFFFLFFIFGYKKQSTSINSFRDTLI